MMLLNSNNNSHFQSYHPRNNSHHHAKCIPINNTVLKSSSSSFLLDSRNNKKLKKAQSNPDIAFLQQRQEELLQELHNEIQSLKKENSVLQQRSQPSTSITTKSDTIEQQCPSQNGTSTEVYPSNSNNSKSKSKDDEPLKVQEEEEEIIHHISEIVIHPTYVKDDNDSLQQKVAENSSKEITTSKEDFENQHRIENSGIEKKKKCHTSRSTTSTNDSNSNPRQRSSSANSRFVLEDTLSILPSDYKESVATLPPINLKPISRISTAEANRLQQLYKYRRASWSIPQSSTKFDPTLLTKRKSIQGGIISNNNNVSGDINNLSLHEFKK